MKIKLDSWHYRWIASKWTAKPRALCWYCQKLILTMAFAIVAGTAIAVVGAFALILLAVPFWQWFFPEWNDVAFQTLSFLMWLVIGGSASYHYRQYLYDYGNLERKVHPYKEPGIVSQYIYAKHRKICPLLEYERYSQ